MYYRYLGGTSYEITMKIYRDCDPGVNTGFDGGLNRDGTLAPELLISIFSSISIFALGLFIFQLKKDTIVDHL